MVFLSRNYSISVLRWVSDNNRSYLDANDADTDGEGSENEDLTFKAETKDLKSLGITGGET
jgi:hypothetical protein